MTFNNIAFSACLALVFACTNISSTEGMQVDIDMRHQPINAGDVTNSDGYAFSVRKALFVISAIELLPCEESTMSKILSDFRLVSVAKAHGPLSPGSYAVPHIVDLMDENGTLSFQAHMEPPPGRYCALRLISSSADADAPGVDQHPEMNGRSLYVSGEFYAPGSSDSHSFVIEADIEQTVELSFDEGELELSVDVPSVSLRLVLDYESMFDGLKPAIQDPMWQAHAVQQNLLLQAQLITCDASGC